MQKSILLILGILISVSAAFGNTYLNFEVEEGYKNPIIELQVKEKGDKKSKIFRITLKSDNKVSTIIDIKKNAFVYVKHNQDNFLLYIRPNDDVQIKYHFNQALKTLHFAGRGAENNQFIADYNKQFKNEGYWKYNAAYFTTRILHSTHERSQLSPSKFYEYLAQKHQEQQLFLAQKKEIHALNLALLQFVSDDIKYTYETQKIGYLIANKKKMGPGDFKRIATHYQLRKDTHTLSIDLIDHPAYLNYIQAYAHFLYLPENTHSQGVELEYYNEIESNMAGRAKYYLLAELLKNVYTYEGTTDLAKKKFATFKKECPYPEYTQEIETLYGELIIDMPEVIAPDFKVQDELGNIRSLASYRNKVVYISFWAHWCKPCINGFKKSHALRAKLDKMGIVLMNVSIDNDQSTWKKALAKHNILGRNFIAINVNEVKRQYGLSSLPAYFIVNKQGKFVYLSDEENRDILKEFEDFLKG